MISTIVPDDRLIQGIRECKRGRFRIINVMHERPGQEQALGMQCCVTVSNLANAKLKFADVSANADETAKSQEQRTIVG